MEIIQCCSKTSSQKTFKRICRAFPLLMLNPYFILQSIAIESNVQKHASGGVMENALFFTISKNLQKNTNTGVLNLTKMMAVKRISPNGWF